MEHWVSATAFPFGLFEKNHRHPDASRWIVWPELMRIDTERLSSLCREVAEGLSSSSKAGAGSVPLDLREYRQGDRRARIHWKMSARRGRWLTTETEEETTPSLLLFIEAWPLSLSHEERERFISFVASVLWSTRRTSLPLGLRTPDHFYRPQGAPAPLAQTMRYLSLIDFEAISTVSAKTDRRQSVSIDAMELWKRYDVRT